VIDVLIVGAGPAGSTAAIRLARAGCEVLLVDRCRFPRPKPCGEFYNPECCRLLAELGLLPTVTAAGARRLTGLSVVAPSGRTLEMPFRGATPFGTPEFALTLGREELDHLLVSAAQAAGAMLWEGAEVREPLLEAGRVVGARLQRGREPCEVRARITLAADGLNSRFARRLGLGARPSGRQTLGLAARYRAGPEKSERILMHAGLKGCCGLAARGSTVNLAMVAPRSEARAIGGDPAGYFHRALALFPALREQLQGPPARVLTVGPLVWRTRRQAVPGALLLGDAAGFYDPFTGQGVTFALLTASLAAETALAELRGSAPAGGQMAEYAVRRRLLLEPKVRVQQAIQQVIARPRLLDHVLERLSGREAVARQLVGIVSDVLPASRALSPAFLAGLVC
jgi:flavin-dependent dehydrogenase